MLSFAIGFDLTATRPSAGGDMTPPEGFAFVVDENGAYVIDADEAYLITETA